jgi:predicted RecB family nuclease
VQRIDGRLIYSASDLNDFLECEHLTELERRVAFGELTRPEQEATAKLLATKGEEHERHHLETLRRLHGSALIEFERPENTVEGLMRAEAMTVEAMERGAKIIYQATFFDGTFVGHADFLERIDTTSERFPWSYEVIDTKLALKTKPYYLVQLCNYSEHVARITGTPPEYGAIVLGSGRKQRFRLSDYAAYYRHLKASFLARVTELHDTYPLVCNHCQICRWTNVCERRRDEDDHLSIVAWMRRDQIARLESANIQTVTALAEAPDGQRPHQMAEGTFETLRTQAQLQHKQRRALANGAGPKHFYRLREAAEGDGFSKLPPPAPGDVFFDIEGDPLYRPDRSLQYLFGVYLPDEGRYRSWWAKDLQEERVAFEAVMDFFAERLKQHPEMHVYHYGSYDVDALKRLAGQFASRGDLLDAFLRRELFADLFTVVRQGLFASQPGYSLKKMEAFYDFKRDTVTLGGDDSIVMFETWLESRDDALLADIERYNADDCRSTYELRQWLLARREELGESLGSPPPWRAEPSAREPEPEPERTALEMQLLGGLPPIDGPDDLREAAQSVRARWLLGHLLAYHRREAKPDWWQYFERLANPNDLEEHDHEAIGGLELRSDIAPYKLRDSHQNQVYTYQFPPQEHRLNKNPIDPHRACGAGELLLPVDDASGTLQIKLAAAINPPESLRALIPGTPLPTPLQRAAIERVARLYADGRLAQAHPATNELLLASTSRLRGITPGNAIQPAAVDPASIAQCVAAIDSSYLFIQGPPGSGKSTRAARAIVELLGAGKRVGILANSHRAVHALLHKVEKLAQDHDLNFQGCHKHSKQTEDSEFRPLLDEPSIGSRDDRRALVDYQLGSGTAFAWCDEALIGTYDYLFIDEAGQVSLADALGASLAARNIVLLGDPLQLKQVSQAAHPAGTERSILQHLLGDDETIRPERGIFLNVTYRMQPEICEFVSEAVYEDRLHADESTRLHQIDSPGLAGAGLRFIPVAHSGCKRKSPEEAEVVVEAIAQLMQGTVTLDGRAPRPFEPSDVLVVAPYNAQRRLIGERLKKVGLGDVRVGTVDKFQGQEAPVVFYSMTTSSGEDMPRNMAFLFEKNRLNVAISRAQCLTVLVCSPRLLEIRCKSPEQMALANLLCLYAERATRREPAAAQ